MQIAENRLGNLEVTKFVLGQWLGIQIY